MTLLNMALDFATSCGSIQFRQAQALDAQSKIAHMQSLPLGSEQWEVEAECIFQTTLARMQSNVYDIVRGTAARYDGYDNVLPPNYRGICKLVKIPTLGWTNINFWGMICTTLAVVIVWILSVRWKTASGDNAMVAILLWKRGFEPALEILGEAGKCAWIGLKPFRELLGRFIVRCWWLFNDFVLEPLANILIECF